MRLHPLRTDEESNMWQFGETGMALLDMLFERMPMSIPILDNNYRIQRYNPTWNDYSASYAPPLAVLLVPGVYYFDHLPGSETMVRPLFERALAGETVRQNHVRLESGGIVTYWDIVLTPLAEGDDIMGILIVSIDTTERVGLRHDLEKRVEARTQELQTLLDVAATANSSLNLDEMLTKTLDLLVDLVVSRSTIKFHVSSILSKLGVNGRSEAVALALKKEMIRSPE